MNAGPPVKSIPKKLKTDAILEAIFEVRFDMEGTIPEVLYGRLAEYGPWKGLEQRKLPAYEIPDPIRQLDANLRFMPVFELRDDKTHRSIRIGPHVLSYHQLAPYVGWNALKPELERSVAALFATAGRLTVRRLGFRYLNALRSDAHGIHSISDLDLKISVEQDVVGGNVNLNFTTDVSETNLCTVRVATPEFAQGALPANTSLVIDVDVFTKISVKIKTAVDANNWLESAHTSEKAQFFHLLTPKTIAALTEVQ